MIIQIKKILDKFCEDIVKEYIYSEKDLIYKNNSINSFTKSLTHNKRELH